MERFRPDNWYELWLRPLLMLDPGRGVYFEFPAPDLRFFALVALTLLLLVSGGWSRLAPVARRILVALFITMWCWSYVSGNGRYFLPGLLLVGPLVVALLSAIKLTRSMRWTLLGLIVVGQVAVVGIMYVANPLANLKWVDANPLGLPDSALRNEPAVFTVAGSNSHSSLMPWFHPQSRWIALLGNYSALPHSAERERVNEALASSLKKYVVADGAREAPAKREAAMVQLRAWLDTMLSQHDLRLSDEPCEFLARDPDGARSRPDAIDLEQAGRWFCRFEVSPPGTLRANAPTVPPLHRRAFETVERVCPRFFPPGHGLDRRGDGVSFRVYPGADTQLRVKDGRVAYRYQLTLNPTVVGLVDEVAAGTATLNCNKLDGRYELPWNR